MKSEVKYVLSYKKREEVISLDHFTSVYEALQYCQTEKIEDPLEIKRIESIEEVILDRPQIYQLVQKKA